MQTAETFGISLAGCFTCLVVWASDAVPPWDVFHLWRWQVRSPASGGCYEISCDIPLLPLAVVPVSFPTIFDCLLLPPILRVFVQYLWPTWISKETLASMAIAVACACALPSSPLAPIAD